MRLFEMWMFLFLGQQLRMDSTIFKWWKELGYVVALYATPKMGWGCPEARILIQKTSTVRRVQSAGCAGISSLIAACAPHPTMTANKDQLGTSVVFFGDTWLFSCTMYNFMLYLGMRVWPYDSVYITGARIHLPLCLSDILRQTQQICSFPLHFRDPLALTFQLQAVLHLPMA